MKYLHTMVHVRDVNASLDFYCAKLGMREVRRYENEKGRHRTQHEDHADRSQIPSNNSTSTPNCWIAGEARTGTVLKALCVGPLYFSSAAAIRSKPTKQRTALVSTGCQRW